MKDSTKHLWFTIIISVIMATIALLAATRLARAQGGIIYVDRDAPGPAHDGLSWTTAYTNVQDALAIAGPGDEIWVAEGVYVPDEGTGQTNDERASVFALKNGVAVYGGFAGTEPGFPGESTRTQRDWTAHVTVLSGDLDGNDTTTPIGNNAYHVVTAQSVTETAVLDGFTVTAGKADVNYLQYDSGGGMYNDDASPTLTNVTFSGNSASEGGGMYNYSNSDLSLTNVTFSGNSASEGGGMYNYSNSNPSLTNVTFSGNSASEGGGMYNYSNSNPSLTNVTFSGNSASEGGGMYNEYSNSTLTDITFSSNLANSYGGGMVIFGSNPSLTNVTFSGNQASMFGGGIVISDSNSSLTDVTFSGNQAYSGGGMANLSGDPSLINVTFSGNRASGFFSLGGGMVNSNGDPSLINVTFSGNQADGDYSSGGGMANSNGDPSLINVTFSGNQANGNYNRGGGMANSNSDPSLINVTFSGNQAYVGGGMVNEYSNSTLTNCILWDNTATLGAQVYNSDSSLVVNYSLVQGGCPSGVSCDTHLLTVDPRFVDADGTDDVIGTPDDDLRLMHDSPAIDAGDNTTLPADTHDLDGDGDTVEPLPHDLDGSPRFVDHSQANTGNGTAPLVDMGAYETPWPWINKVASSVVLNPRDPLTYTITFGNHTGITATDVIITDVVPSNWVSATGVISSGAAITDTGASPVYAWRVEDLSPGEGGAITITGILSTSLPPGQTFTNTAHLFAVFDGASGIITDSATVTRYGADLAIDKYDDLDPVAAGTPLTYTLVITNHGPTGSQAIVLTDTLPGGVTLVSASPGCYPATSATVTCTVGGLAYQATTAVAIVVTAPATAGTITNTVTVAGVSPDPNPGNNTATETTTVSEWADLAVAKVAAPNPVLVGQPLTYTLTVTNYGPYDAHNVLLTDTLPADVVLPADVAIDTDAALLLHLDEPSGAMTFNDASGSGNHGTCSGDTCPTAGIDGHDGQAARFDGADDTIDVTIDVSETAYALSLWFSTTFACVNCGIFSVDDGTLGDGGHDRHVYLSGGDLCARTYDDETMCTAGVSYADGNWHHVVHTFGGDVGGQRLYVDGALRQSGTKPFSDFNWQTGANVGFSNDATDDYFAGLIDEVIIYDEALSPDQVSALYRKQLRYDLGTLGAGEVVTITLVVTPTAGGTLTNTAYVTGDEFDLFGSNNAVTQTTTAGEIDLALDKVVNAAKLSEGNAIAYTITLTNHGPITATGVIVSDVLPGGIDDVVYTATHGVYTDTIGAWDVGALSVGQVATLTLTGAISTGMAAQTITNAAMLNTSNPEDVFTYNNIASATTTVAGADLSLSKSVDNPVPSPRDTIIYTIAVTNHGPDASSGVVISDALPPGVTYVTSGATQGGYNPAASAWDVGLLAAGETATLTLAATVDAGTHGQTITNTAVVSGSAQPDSVTGNNAGSAAITVNTPPIANDDGGPAYITNEDTPFTTGDVLSNDTDTEGSVTVGGFDSDATQGTVTDNGDGTFDYDPNGQFDYLAPGEQDLDTFTYVVADTSGLTDTATVAITINGVNDAPTISDILNQRTDPGVTVGPIPFTVGDAETEATLLLLGSTSSNQGLLSDSNIALAGSGTNRTIILLPTAGTTGTAIITVTVSDGELAAYDTFLLAAGVNSPPEFTSTPVTTATVGVLYTYAVTVHDADPKDVLTITAPVSATWLHLTQTTSRTATLSGTPVAESDYAVELQVSDGQDVASLTATQSFAIHVSAGGDEYYIYLPLVLKN